jgi:hypothetical protein
MPGASLLPVLLALWAAVTAVFLMVMIMKSLTGLKEEDIVILDPAEERLAAEQQMIISKVERLTRWAKYFGFTSLALLVMVGGIWLYRAMLVFNGQVSQ